jgi:hypothetical protein
MSECTFAFDGAKCGEPTVSTWEGSCKHGHVMPGIDVCAGHEWLAHLMTWACIRCAQDHACLVRLKMAAGAVQTPKRPPRV